VKELDLSSDDSHITRDEFTLLMLAEQGIVTKDDLGMCRSKFDKLDVDKTEKLGNVELQIAKARRWARKAAGRVLYGNLFKRERQRRKIVKKEMRMAEQVEEEDNRAEEDTRRRREEEEGG